MLNWNPLWPMTSDESRHGKAAPATLPGNGALWSPTAILEFQASFWSQVIDASRNFWSMCAAAFPGLPAMAAASINPATTETAMEPAAANHAVQDLESVLESQTRFWNHMLDANRNLWSGVTWNLPESPFAESAVVASTAPRSVATVVPKARPAVKKSVPMKKKVQRKH